MTLLKVAQIGHPVLLEPAQQVADPEAPDIQQLLGDMLATMLDAAGIGIAAPQVYRSLRAIIALPIAVRGGDLAEVEPLILLNPTLTLAPGEPVLGVEGCLSIPQLRGLVPRAPALTWRGQDPAGRWIEGEAEGLFARILQHEVDHLDGVLFPMRMTDLSLLASAGEAARLSARLDDPRG